MNSRILVGTLAMGIISSSYGGICTSEAIRVQSTCTLDQFDSDCKAAKAEWNTCRQIIRERAEESRAKEIKRKREDYENRNDNSLSSWLKYITGIDL